MHHVFLGTALLAGFVASVATAEAASHHKHRHAGAMWNPPVTARTVGPSWTAPNQCFTDEGYGRYASCDGGGQGY